MIRTALAFSFRKEAVMQQAQKKLTAGGSLKFGVFFLTVANLFVKALGFVYKVPLNALLGDEMASVNAASALFAVLYTAAAGVPGALSLSIARARAARDMGRIRGLFDATLGVLLILGLFFSLFVLLLAKPLAYLQGDGTGALCTVAIAPALFFTAVTGVLRGFFQGFSDLVPTAVSELLEALGKAVFGVALAVIALHLLGRSRATAAALAVFGITLGIMLGTLYLALRFKKRKSLLLVPATIEANGSASDKREALRSVFLVALPITLSAALMSLSSFIDAQLMRPLLSSYCGDEALAKALYSDYSTGALTLFNLPAVLIMPLSTALMPYVGGALAGERVQRARKVALCAIKFTALLSLPAALGLSVLASPSLAFVFHADADMAQNAGPLLALLAPAIAFSAFLTISSALLQAFKRERLPILSLGIGIAVKLLLIAPLVRAFGSRGVPLSTLLFYAVAALINLVLLLRVTHLRIPVFDVWVRPLLCALLCAGTAYMTHKGLLGHIGEGGALLCAVFLAMAVYLALLFLFRAIGREELSLLPFGKSRFVSK